MSKTRAADDFSAIRAAMNEPDAEVWQDITVGAASVMKANPDLPIVLPPTVYRAAKERGILPEGAIEDRPLSLTEEVAENTLPSDFHRRLGRFFIAKSVIEGDPARVLRSLRGVILIKVEMSWVSNGLVCVGLSEHFEPLSEGPSAPEYWWVDDEGGGKWSPYPF